MFLPKRPSLFFSLEKSGIAGTETEDGEDKKDSAKKDEEEMEVNPFGLFENDVILCHAVIRYAFEWLVVQ